MPHDLIVSDLLFTRLSQADDAISRLDEKVSATRERKGFLARRDFAEAVAWSWTGGAVAPLEDLVLHDQGMDARTPDGALLAAHSLVLSRRKATIGHAALLSIAGVDWLAGRRPAPPVSTDAWRQPRAPNDLDAPRILERLGPPLLALEGREAAAPSSAVAEWLAFVRILDDGIPPLLAAAAMLEAWWVIDPLPRQRYLGGILTGLWLLSQHRIRSHLLGFEVGLRSMTRRGGEYRGRSVASRLSFWLGVGAHAANSGLEDINRLDLARQVMTKNLAGRRAHARAHDVMDLLLELPVVSAPLIADRLGISQQSARRSLEELGSVVREISGRTRFRAWRV